MLRLILRFKYTLLFHQDSKSTYHINIAGSTRAGEVLVISSALQPQRTRLPSHLYARRHARDPGVRRPGCHQCIYLDPFHGHALHPHRQQVSIFVKEKKMRHLAGEAL